MTDTGQKQLHAEKYQKILVRFYAGDTCTFAQAQAGRPTNRILPASFGRIPWHMRTQYQDAMAICRRYGTPDSYVTFNATPMGKRFYTTYNPGKRQMIAQTAFHTHSI